MNAGRSSCRVRLPIVDCGWRRLSQVRYVNLLSLQSDVPFADAIDFPLCAAKRKVMHSLDRIKREKGVW